MRTATARTGTILLSLIMAAVSACDIGSALFTDEELDSMYEIGLSQSGSSISNGARVLGSIPIKVSVSSIDGAPEASYIDLRLLDSDGDEASALSFPVDDKAVTVPPVTLPEDLADGYYQLNVSLRDSGGKMLSSYSSAILIFAGNLSISRLAAYPGEIIAGGVSLLKLEAAYSKGLDPWARWSLDGTRLSEGFISSHADRLPWRTPSASGVYLARAELFPFKPPAGFDVPPLAKAEIRLPVSGSSAAGDPFSRIASWSVLPFGADFKDHGQRPHEAEPVATGIPYLDTYATGFGYSMGAGAGAFSASSLLPVIEPGGLVAPFTAVFVIAPVAPGPKPGSGFLLVAFDDKGSRNFVIGIADGYPYVGSGGARVTSNAILPADVTRLAISVAPSIEGISVSFYLDERPAGTGSVPGSLFIDTPGACSIAGENGYVAIYDELRIIPGPYPAFYVSQALSKGASLIAASGFEGGSLGMDLTPSGGFSLGDGKLTLQPGSSLAVGSKGIPAAGASLSFELLEGVVESSIRLADGSELAVATDGSVRLDGAFLGFKPAAGAQATRTVSIESTGDGIRLYGAGESSIKFNTRMAGDSRWQISAIGRVPAVLSKVTASAFSAPLAAARSGSGPNTGELADSTATLSMAPALDQIAGIGD